MQPLQHVIGEGERLIPEDGELAVQRARVDSCLHQQRRRWPPDSRLWIHVLDDMSGTHRRELEEILGGDEENFMIASLERLQKYGDIEDLLSTPINVNKAVWHRLIFGRHDNYLFEGELPAEEGRSPLTREGRQRYLGFRTVPTKEDLGRMTLDGRHLLMKTGFLLKHLSGEEIERFHGESLEHYVLSADARGDALDALGEELWRTSADENQTGPLRDYLLDATLSPSEGGGFITRSGTLHANPSRGGCFLKALGLAVMAFDAYPHKPERMGESLVDQAYHLRMALTRVYITPQMRTAFETALEPMEHHEDFLKAGLFRRYQMGKLYCR